MTESKTAESKSTEPVGPKHMWIQIFGGGHFDFVTCRGEGVTNESYAQSLSQICRYTGHPKRHYSVAEHSVRVAFELARRGANQQLQLAGLLHDAPEIFTGDMSSPLKRYLRQFTDSIDWLETMVTRWVVGEFGLPEGVTENPLIKTVDREIVYYEKQALFDELSCADWADANASPGWFVPPKSIGWRAPTAGNAWLAALGSLQRGFPLTSSSFKAGDP